MKRFFIKNKNSSGFTLVETLVAVSIFSVSILVLLQVLSQGISDTNYAKKKITAAYLAQEGIEHIRNMRDTYVLYSTPSQTGWNTFISRLTGSGAMCQNSNGCYFNDNGVSFNTATVQAINATSIVECGATCASLLYDSATGKYGYQSGTSSGYIRKIKVTQVNANELKISSTVFWTQGSGTYQVTLSSSLFNWVE